MNTKDLVSVRVKKSVRAKARKLAETLSKERGRQVKLHEAFEHKFNN